VLSGKRDSRVKGCYNSKCFLTRLAAVPLMVIMVVAIVSTKLPIWAGHDLWIFPALPDGSAERPFWQRGALAGIGYLMAGARARRHGR